MFLVHKSFVYFPIIKKKILTSFVSFSLLYQTHWSSEFIYFFSSSSCHLSIIIKVDLHMFLLYHV